MSTDTNPASVNFGPDWLRNKPVFSKHRYGQEELLGLWSCSVPCPETLRGQTELAASVPLKPVSLTNYTDEEKDSYNNRGQVSDRGRGRGRGGHTRGNRRPYEYNSRYYDRENARDNSADSDNWRRRDPDPAPDAADKQQPITPPSNETNNTGFSKTPPYYPPFPSKATSPPTNNIIADNKENNSWKRTTEHSPHSQDSHTDNWKQRTTEHSPHSQDSSHTDTWKRAEPDTDLHSPESMLRSISKTLQVDSQSAEPTPAFSTTSIFSTFNNTGTTNSSMFSMAAGTSLPAGLSDIRPATGGIPDMRPTPSSLPGAGLGDMRPPETTQSYTLQDVKHLISNAPGNISSQVPNIPLSTPNLDTQSLFNTSSNANTPQSPFPSLSEIGKSLQSVQVSPQHEMMRGQQPRGQGFLPPPALPLPGIQQPVRPPSYSADELWFYLDPKGNTQGPFDSVKMYGWFNEGYFGMDLEIRRTNEDRFTKLETMITQCGRIPFQPEEKTSPPPVSQPSNVPISTLPSAWNTPNTAPSIWGAGDPVISSNDPFSNISTSFLDESAKAARAEEIRKEIECAMAVEQQRKQHELEEERRRQEDADKEAFMLEQQRMIQVKLQEDQKQKESEMMRFREEEMRKKKLFEEETERIRQEKERLERERKKQEERVRVELEEAERARQALAKERLNLEREREIVKQKEEELKRKAESERRKLENEARAAEEQRKAAQKAAAEAKALAQAHEDAKNAAIREARLAYEAELARKAAEPPKNVWGSPPKTGNNNPWANIPAPQMTQSTTRTPASTGTKGWGKTNSQPAPVALSTIQLAEKQSRENKPKSNYKPVETPKQLGMWGATAHKPQPTKSLADIQREEEKRVRQEHNYNFARQNDWNPVAGMLEEDHPKPKPKPQPKKSSSKPPPVKQPAKQTTKPAAPLLDMFSTSEPKDAFTVWCESQVNSFKNQHIDVPTFISFLRDVESPMEVREYVVSYLGDNKSTDEFIKEFVARRKTVKSSDGLSIGFSTLNNKKPSKAPAPAPAPPSSRKGKRKKMQKVNAASLLGINCTASSDARNRGDIDSVAIQ